MSGETSTGPRKKNANRVIAGVCIAFFGGFSRRWTAFAFSGRLLQNSL